MKTIIAGSRTFIDYKYYPILKSAVKEAGENGINITEVVSGCAKGIDKFGETYALRNHIPVRKFPAQWKLNGVQAGYMRNEDMAEYADALIAIWDGNSSGTAHMIRMAHKMGLKVFVKKVSPEIL